MRKPNAFVQSIGLSRLRQPKPRTRRFVVLSVLVLALASCTALPGTVSAPTSATLPVPSPAAGGILSGDPQATAFDEVSAAIDKLYIDHPDVNSFVAQDVTYTPATRDKVLKICHEGGLVSTDAERESQQVLACAPLIFFFYTYGQQSGVPESTEIARLLYWYTVTSHSSDSKEVLTQLLQGWGIK